MTVTVQGGELSQREVQAYIDHIQEKNHQKIDDLTITVDGDYVDLNYTLAPVPFERIRRITGYLVGTMDRWNDAKKAEERDRVKHNV
ncbi:MAG: anaerobic ribonucleoside-triphosphate reductase [Butyricicoccaceae bacterium]